MTSASTAPGVVQRTRIVLLVVDGVRYTDHVRRGPTPFSRTPVTVVRGPRKGASVVPFSQEFTEQIVELHRKGGHTFIDLPREFNLSATTVSNWVRAADKRDAKLERARVADSAAGQGGESDKAKIRRLEKELARKEQELEILRKALAFFARRADQ